MNKSLKITACLLSLCSLLFISSCSSLIAATAAGQLDEDYGKRTLGTRVEDNTIEAKAKRIIYQIVSPENNEIQVTSFNRILLITGKVESQSAINKINTQVKNIRHLRKVHNELISAKTSTFNEKFKDSFLSTRINTTLMSTAGVDNSRIETIVSGGTAYLLGLVTQEEAQRAVESLRTLRGLKKIVRVFEYIDNQVE